MMLPQKITLETFRLMNEHANFAMMGLKRAKTDGPADARKDNLGRRRLKGVES